MDSLSETAARILEIETRQDKVLRELQQLDRQVERVLADCLASLELSLASAEGGPAAAAAVDYRVDREAA